MRRFLVLPLAFLAIAGARVAREAANASQREEMTPAPYAPSPAAAPIVALGYRELAADLMLVRLVGYFSAGDSDPRESAALAEAVAALDPQLRRIYEFGALAMTDARRTTDQDLRFRAIRLLEQGMREFPDYWRIFSLAGAVYLVELETKDPAQRRAWDEKGSMLLEQASRKPGAPNDLALHAAMLHTKFGQKERAISSLKEMLLITTDPKAREGLLAELAKVTAASSDDLAAELLEAKRSFDRAWKRERGSVTPTFYLLLGPPLGTTFDLGELATGGRDVIGSEGFEHLEPLTDEPAPPGDAGVTSGDGPSSP